MNETKNAELESQNQKQETMDTEKKPVYVAIDLKSFYASVECNERGLDPLKTNLVVADVSRTEKTICLAVSPSLKAYGISGRARLFEVVAAVKRINADRRRAIHGRAFHGKSYDADELAADPYLELDYIAATPQMALYMKYSTTIYDIYLKYISAEDIHVYSIDEVFMDVTSYLNIYHMTAHELAIHMIRDVLKTTRITATAGIADNMYLCKIAMDVVAKHMPADRDGVRIAELDEMSYRELLWDHKPLTDFWRVGRGYARKLQNYGIETMGDVARCSVDNEDLLYDLFGVNAELLIDHAWGYEPCTMADIKKYRPSSNSLSSGQVLKCPYDSEKGRLIVKEMTDLLVLDLVDKHLVTDQMTLTVGYDVNNLQDQELRARYKGPVVKDHYGRQVPKHAHGTARLPLKTSSSRLITDAVMELYDRIVNQDLYIRRVYVVACNVINEDLARKEQEKPKYRQLSFFDEPEDESSRIDREKLEREHRAQKAVLAIQKKYGKNALLRGMNLQEGGTTIERNGEIGGHRA